MKLQTVNCCGIVFVIISCGIAGCGENEPTPESRAAEALAEVASSFREASETAAASGGGEDETAGLPSVKIGGTLDLDGFIVKPISCTLGMAAVKILYSFDDTPPEKTGPYYLLTFTIENKTDGRVVKPLCYATAIDEFGNRSKQTDGDPVESEEGNKLAPGESCKVVIACPPENKNAKKLTWRVGTRVADGPNYGDGYRVWIVTAPVVTVNDSSAPANSSD